MSINRASRETSAFRHIHYESVGSTNALLVEMARAGDPGMVWLTAGEQTQGRGSRGRAWKSVPGNLYASLLLRNPCPKSVQHELTFVAAVSARKAFAAVTGLKADVRLKWPNDVMLNRKKCGGILLESGEFDKTSYVIVGMGLNCRSFPDDTLYPSTSLTHEGYPVAPEKLFDELQPAFASTLAVWAQGENFAAIRQAWLVNAHGLHEPASVRIPGGETMEGSFSGIDERGFMMLKMADGVVRKISTADIFFGRATTGGE